MDKRTFIALFVVVILFFVWTTYFAPKPQPQPAPAAQKAEPASETQAGTTPETETEIDTQTAEEDTLFQGADSLQELVLTGKNFEVTFSNQGASISSIRLKDFAWVDSDSLVNLVPADGELAGIALLQHRSTGPINLKNKLWQSKQTGPQEVRFWLGADEAKPLVSKNFRLDDKYGILMDVEVDLNEDVYGIEYDFSAGIADSEKVKQKSKGQDYKLLLHADNKFSKLKLDKIAKNSQVTAVTSFKWAALRSKYFSIAIHETGTPLTSNYLPGVNSVGNPSVVLDSRDNNPSQTWKQSFVIYAGPADYDLMKSYANSRLELVPDRGPGWLRWLAHPFAWLLKFLNGFIHNFGVVIIIFSILLKLLLHPLTKKSMDANQKMQRIQPRVQEIQAQYKSNPQQMQQELSKLYKEAGASPMSGCLPLLLQMPIFIALYSVLRYALEMRNARFLGWLNLSEPDPLYILPIIMAIFMIIQSLLTRPSKKALEQMDEKQRAMQQSTRMMTWIMPILLLLIFSGLPSGLVLYYTVFNILSVAHQYYTQKRLKQKETT